MFIVFYTPVGVFFFFFFFNDTATTEIYTLSLHDALPTSPASAPAVGNARPLGSVRSAPTTRCRSQHAPRPPADSPAPALSASLKRWRSCARSPRRPTHYTDMRYCSPSAASTQPTRSHSCARSRTTRPSPQSPACAAPPRSHHSDATSATQPPPSLAN